MEIFSAQRVFAVASLIISFSVLVIVYFIVLVIVDPYGIFGRVQGRKLPVIYNERLTKYMLSLRYIPHNFQGVLLGTSVSDNLDAESWQNPDHIRFYNASIMGANLEMLRPLASRLFNRGIRNAIICLTPYMMKQVTAAKPFSFRSPIFHALFDIVNLSRMAAVWLLRRSGLSRKFRWNQFDAHGTNHYYHLFRQQPIGQKIRQVIGDNLHRDLEMSALFFQSLTSMVRQMEAQRIHYLFYIHPWPTAIFESKAPAYRAFSERVRAIIPEKRIIDFTAPGFQEFTSDYTNYIDHGHLSVTGQARLGHLLMREFSNRRNFSTASAAA